MYRACVPAGQPAVLESGLVTTQRLSILQLPSQHLLAVVDVAAREK